MIRTIQRASRGEALLNLLHTNRKKLVENEKLEGNLGDKDHKMIKSSGA